MMKENVYQYCEILNWSEYWLAKRWANYETNHRHHQYWPLSDRRKGERDSEFQVSPNFSVPSPTENPASCACAELARFPGSPRFFTPAGHKKFLSG